MKVAICDDDIMMTSIIEEMLVEIEKKEKIKIDIDVFFDGKNLITAFEQGIEYQIIYLDIEMKDLDGIQTARYIRKIDVNTLIIYMSGYEEYLKELFEVEPFRFLSKPIEKEKFEKYFKDAYRRLQLDKEILMIHFKNDFFRVSIGKIIYFESNKRYIYVIMENRKYMFYGKLNDVEKQMEKSGNVFLRIHQSYLVNYKFVERINSTNVRMYNGKELPVSEDRQKALKEKLCELMGGYK